MEKAYSKQQFLRSGFDAIGYRFPNKEGVFSGTLLCKRWGNKMNILAYFEFDSIGKIICAAWQDAEYMGLPNIEIGSRVIARFEKQPSGKIYLRALELES